MSFRSNLVRWTAILVLPVAVSFAQGARFDFDFSTLKAVESKIELRHGNAAAIVNAIGGLQDPDLAALEAFQNANRVIVERAMPSVVAVRVERGQLPTRNMLPNKMLALESSGFVIDSKGLVLCTAEGAVGQGPFRITFNDGREYVARKLGADELVSNLALLELEGATNLTALNLGNSDRARPGDFAILVGGSRAGYTSSVTIGTIAGVDRMAIDPQKGRFMPLIQFNGLVGAGEPGSPILNARGEVIGVLSGALAALDPDGRPLNMQTQTIASTGFAVPSNMVARVVDQIKRTGKVQYAVLGLKYNNAPRGGALVLEVVVGGPAAKAGIKAEDVIVEFDGRSTPNVAELTKMLYAARPNSQVTVTVLRNGVRQPVTVRLGVAP